MYPNSLRRSIRQVSRYIDNECRLNKLFNSHQTYESHDGFILPVWMEPDPTADLPRLIADWTRLKVVDRMTGC